MLEHTYDRLRVRDDGGYFAKHADAIAIRTSHDNNPRSASWSVQSVAHFQDLRCSSRDPWATDAPRGMRRKR